MLATCVSVVRAARYRGLVVPTRRPRVSAPLAPEPEPEPVAGQGVGGVGRGCIICPAFSRTCAAFRRNVSGSPPPPPRVGGPNKSAKCGEVAKNQNFGCSTDLRSAMQTGMITAQPTPHHRLCFCANLQDFDPALQVGENAPPARSPTHWPPGLPTWGGGGGGCRVALPACPGTWPQAACAGAVAGRHRPGGAAEGPRITAHRSAVQHAICQWHQTSATGFLATAGQPQGPGTHPSTLSFAMGGDLWQSYTVCSLFFLFFSFFKKGLIRTVLH